MLYHKNLNLIGTEIFIRGRKINISHVFITESYFSVPKNNETKFCGLSQKITARPFSFLMIDTNQNFFYILERIF